jgi:hypothetical protein
MAALISRYAPHVRVLVPSANLYGGDALRSEVDIALERFGLRVDTRDCSSIIVHGLPPDLQATPTSQTSTAVDQARYTTNLVSCHLVTDGVADPARYATDRQTADLVLDRLEDACPELFQPRRPLTEPGAGGWVRRYANTDLTAWVSRGRVKFTQLVGDDRVVFVGRESDWAKAPLRLACGPQLSYTPLERLAVARPADRIKFIASACAGRRVLDLGAMDETAWKAKRGRGTWLHEEISHRAVRVDGIDNSALVTPEGIRTGPNSMIRRGDSTDPERLLATLEEVPDVIVAGELIEHVENPLQFLKRFVAIERLSGKTLILSTPNATALHNILIALARRESTHHDHLCILSYKTLATLCTRSGCAEWEIIPYFARFTEMQERHSGFARLAVRAAERIVNAFEWMFPLLSFGYIVRIRL